MLRPPTGTACDTAAPSCRQHRAAAAHEPDDLLQLRVLQSDGGVQEHEDRGTMGGGALLGQGEERRAAALRDPTETAEHFIQTFAAVGPAEVGRGAQVELRCPGRAVRGPNRDSDGAGQEQRQPDFKPVGHAAVSPAPGRRCRRIDTLARRTAPRRRDDGRAA